MLTTFATSLLTCAVLTASMDTRATSSAATGSGSILFGSTNGNQDCWCEPCFVGSPQPCHYDGEVTQRALRQLREPRKPREIEKCEFGHKCCRKDGTHFKRFSHPCSHQWFVNGKEGVVDGAIPVPDETAEPKIIRNREKFRRNLQEREEREQTLPHEINPIDVRRCFQQWRAEISKDHNERVLRGYNGWCLAYREPLPSSYSKEGFELAYPRDGARRFNVFHGPVTRPFVVGAGTHADPQRKWKSNRAWATRKRSQSPYRGVPTPSRASVSGTPVATRFAGREGTAESEQRMLSDVRLGGRGLSRESVRQYWDNTLQFEKELATITDKKGKAVEDLRYKHGICKRSDRAGRICPCGRCTETHCVDIGNEENGFIYIPALVELCK